MRTPVLFRLLLMLIAVPVPPAFAAAAAPASKPASDAILNKRLPEVKLDNLVLGDAIDTLHDLSGVVVSLDTEPLRKLKIDVTTTVNLHVDAGHMFREVLD